MCSNLCKVTNNAFKYLFRGYHSDKVFGYKRKPKSGFQVPEEILQSRYEQSNFFRLVTAYRQHAHKYADLNPVQFANVTNSFEFDLKRFGLKNSDRITFEGILKAPISAGTIEEAVEFLQEIYMNKIAVEFLHLEDEEEIEWISNRIEELASYQIDKDTKLRICREMLRSQNFDNFLANKFPGVKRYGGEGAESMMAFFSEFLQLSTEDSTLEQIVIAMPHRGRLNLLTGLLNFPPVDIFAKLQGKSNFPTKYQVTGDVLSHFISSTDFACDGKNLHISLLYNPSHLEAVNPVSMGKTRAKMLDAKDGDYGESDWGDKVLNLQVHGDAAIIGQGVNQECLVLSKVPHFEIGGSIHLVVNNQLGFTTPGDRGRSSRYCTDLAKIISAPVIHVNGDCPEMVVKATKLAFEYQRKFRKEIFLDLNCYRQWGHNELDDPTFTNPALYKQIRSRKTVPDRYTNNLLEEKILNHEDKTTMLQEHTSWLNEHLKSAENYQPKDDYFKNNWNGFCQAEESVSLWDTGIDLNLMTLIGNTSVKYPQTFNIHPTLVKTHVKNRLSRIAEGKNIDWAAAESLAFGSLLYEGHNVRISGQDVGRGTFSHRHIMLVDQENNNIYIPLNNLMENQVGKLEVANSILSEEAVLGYEYGMSIENPNNLIIWEAQFGDFFNGAQIILDTFVTTGEAKWLWSSGLVILLPHGYDGAGPEHSSARIERFLQSTDSQENKVDGDNVNMQVCQPSTPAQYFHLLRRQIVRNFRKPLVIISPKTLLRLSDSTSSFDEMTSGTYFKPVIGDESVDVKKVEKILLTSGKHFYTLREKRKALGVDNVAILRLECFCPFPVLDLRQQIAKYPKVKSIIWCQEEPQNMGGWTFIKPRFENLVGKKISFCGRPTQAAPAVGIGSFNTQQVSEISSKPFEN